jgi:hypothetical protein
LSVAFFYLGAEFKEFGFHEFFLFDDLVKVGHGLVEVGCAVFKGLFELFVFGGDLVDLLSEGFL